MQPETTATPAQPALGRGVRILGWAFFAAFELTVVLLVWIAASVRCCAAGSGGGPESAGEWVGLAIFAATMLLLGAAIGLGTACIAEALCRLYRRITARPENAP